MSRMRHNAPMCYSAQIQAAYMKYLRETGAEMDIDQFVEIFGARVSDSSIRIPRAVERWFDEPKNDGERKIKAFIDEYRAAEITKLEREVFAQKKRLADAERTLASKTDQGRGREQTHRRQQDRAGADAARSAESHQTACRRGAHLSRCTTRPSSCRTATGASCASAAITAASRASASSSTGKLPGLYNARRDSLGKYWQGLFGVSHAVMMVESFFENVDRDGKNEVLHFVPQPGGHDAHRVPVPPRGRTRRAGGRCCRSRRSPMSRRPKSRPRGTTA